MKRKDFTCWATICLLLLGCTIQRPISAQTTSLSAQMPGKVVTYPPPKNVAHVRNSQTFRVSVNGQPLYVEEYRNASYAHFSFAGTVEIEVTVVDAPHTYTISPASYQLQPKFSDKTIRFSLQVPRKLIVHQSATSERHVLYTPVLFIFADPLEAPLRKEEKVINVLDRQIDNTGQKDETVRIQQLIDEAAAEQSTLYFPSGTYRITTLKMKSNLSLYLAGGARLQVAEPPAGFREPALHFNTVENVRVFGQGVIDGNGVNIRYLPRESDDLRTVIYAYQAYNCVLEGITIQNPSMFNALITNSESWYIYNVKAIDYANEDLARFAGDDGIDPVGSKNVRIDNVFVASGDSPISVKGGIRWSQIGDILVSNSVLFNYASGGSIGASDLNGNHISKVTWENIDVVSALFGLTLSNQEGPGTLSDFLYKNIRYEHVRGSLFWLRAITGPIQKVRYHNISATGWGTSGKGGDTGNQITAGSAVNAVDTIVFDRVQVDGKLLDSANYSDTLAISEHVDHLLFANTEPTVVTIMATSLYARKGAPPGVFTIHRSGQVDKALVIPFVIRGTAQNGIDYTKIPNRITIPAGASSTQVKIAVRPDFATQEDMETVMLSLEGSHSTDYMLGPNHHAVVTIIGPNSFGLSRGYRLQ